MNLTKVIYKPSFLLLILANAVVIAVAIVNKWSAAEMLWTYWLQSLIIGVFQVIKMADLKQFSAQGLEFNGRQINVSAAKPTLIPFFLFHYGFFHFIYAIFLAQFFRVDGWNFLLWPALAFAANHALSFYLNRTADRARMINLCQLFLAPYRRIIPMHIVLMLGAFLAANTAVVIIFLLLKTIVDVITHAREHSPTGEIKIDA